MLICLATERSESAVSQFPEAVELRIPSHIEQRNKLVDLIDLVLICRSSLLTICAYAQKRSMGGSIIITINASPSEPLEG